MTRVFISTLVIFALGHFSCRPHAKFYRVTENGRFVRQFVRDTSRVDTTKFSEHKHYYFLNSTSKSQLDTVRLKAIVGKIFKKNYYNRLFNLRYVHQTAKKVKVKADGDVIKFYFPVRYLHGYKSFTFYKNTSIIVYQSVYSGNF